MVHLLAAAHVAVKGAEQILLHDVDGLEGQGIGEHGVEGGHIGLDGVGQGVHAGVGHQLGGHGLGQGRVDDGHVGGDIEVGQGVLDALLVVGDDGESGDLGGGARGGGDGAEPGLLAQLREAEGGDQILKGGLRVLVEGPHGLGRVDGRATAHGDDPIGFKLPHDCRAAHHGFHRGIGLYVLDQAGLNAGLLQIAQGLVHKAELLHGAAAQHQHRTGALQILQIFQRIGAMIDVSGKRKTGHNRYLRVYVNFKSLKFNDLPEPIMAHC